MGTHNLGMTTEEDLTGGPAVDEAITFCFVEEEEEDRRFPRMPGDSSEFTSIPYKIHEQMILIRDPYSTDGLQKFLRPTVLATYRNAGYHPMFSW